MPQCVVEWHSSRWQFGGRGFVGSRFVVFVAFAFAAVVVLVLVVAVVAVAVAASAFVVACRVAAETL